MKPPLLEFIGIEKAFFGVRVLKNVSFSVPAGGLVGLVGENGAGKSTLMNILGGNLRPDAGCLRFDGADYKANSPQVATRCGIAFIHQELNLFPNLSVAENIFLTRFPCTPTIPFIQRGELHRRTAELLHEVGLNVRPDQLVETLSAGERQLIEIAKAVSLNARLLILDEPTTSLSDREAERLFALIARFRARGLTLIYISHTLADIFRLSDEVVILRDGEVVGLGPTKTFTTESLVTAMVGRKLDQIFPDRPSPAVVAQSVPNLSYQPGPPLWEVRGITQPGVVTDISFTLNRGEVVGLAGLMGAGRSELARILFGLDPYTAGQVRLKGERLDRLTPQDLIQRGVGFLTENRQSEGLCLDGAVASNLTLVTLPDHGKAPVGWLMSNSLRAAVARIREVVKLDSKATDDQSVRTLSGGNQQKVVLGKWLLSDPQVLLLDEPTRGIDVGAKFEIYRLIYELAEKGAGILVISSELEELIGLSDRILVLRSGRLVAEWSRPEFDREQILRAALGSQSEEVA